jgi:hypothetical protein
MFYTRRRRAFSMNPVPRWGLLKLSLGSGLAKKAFHLV